MELLHTSSKGSVNTYLNYLRNDGFVIEEKLLKHGKKNYSLKAYKNEGNYEEITKKDWQNYIIISSLNDALSHNNEMFRNKLINYILIDKELNIHLKYSALSERINELCKTGYIVEKKDMCSAKLYPGPEINIIEGFDFEEADLLHRDLSYVPEAYPFHDTLQEIKYNMEKLSDVIVSVEEAPSFLSQGKKYKKTYINKELSAVFHSCNFKSYVCDITYLSKDFQRTENVRLGIGLIVYVLEKDKIYVLGKKYISNKPSKNTILNIERIISISESIQDDKKIKNPYWECIEFRSIYDEMLSISVEPCEFVVLRFEDKDYIESKLEILKRTRKKAKIEKRDGYIYYSDMIRGLSDLRNYLRTFTERCVIISPKTLKNEMTQSIRHNLLLYGENDETII